MCYYLLIRVAFLSYKLRKEGVKLSIVKFDICQKELRKLKSVTVKSANAKCLPWCGGRNYKPLYV